MKKVAYKAVKIGATQVFIVNNLYQGYERDKEYNENGVRIITISWLYDTYNDRSNAEAFMKIKTAFHGGDFT